MEIKTKFNIGNTIYIIYSNNEDMWCIKEVIIIEIKIFIKEEIEIRYNTKATRENTWINGAYEKLCFSSISEAQAECDRRNSERTN